jgi:hypothetical protein
MTSEGLKEGLKRWYENGLQNLAFSSQIILQAQGKTVNINTKEGSNNTFNYITPSCLPVFSGYSFQISSQWEFIGYFHTIGSAYER